MKTKLYLTTLLVFLFFQVDVFAELVDQKARIVAKDCEKESYFGNSVAIDGDYIVIGSPGGERKANKCGSAYLFDAKTGKQLHKIIAEDAIFDDRFGCSVAIDDNIAIVGSQFNDHIAGSNAGSAYLFDIKTGKQLYKLTAKDAESDDRFGVSVAISGNIAIVGAYGNDDKGSSSGSAYLFDIRTGKQLYKLISKDLKNNDHFGWSVAISNNVAIVGAYGYDDYTGSAYLFDVKTGKQLHKIVAKDTSKYCCFGYSVDIDKNIAILGTTPYEFSGIKNSSVYVFNVKTGQQLKKIIVNSSPLADYFGRSIALNNNIIVVGSHGTNSIGTNSGCIYLFNAKTGKRLARFVARDLSSFDNFGWAVDINNKTIIVGAPQADSKELDTGAAYIFDLNR